jgi:hypothetical protein
MMNVIDDPKWLNKNYGMVFEVKSSPLLGKKLVFVYSLNQYKWMEYALAEVIVSKGLGVMKGPAKPKEHGQKVSAFMKGKKKSPDHVNNIVESFNSNPNNRGWIVYTNGNSNIRIRRGESPPAGYYQGSMLEGKSTPNKNVGKSYEEIYGIDKAIQIKSKRSSQLKQNNPGKKMKGKTYEEMYDADTVIRLKEARRKSGKKNNKIYEICKDDALVFSGDRLGAVEFLYSNYKGSKAHNLYNTDWLSTQNIKVDIQYKNR